MHEHPVDLDTLLARLRAAAAEHSDAALATALWREGKPLARRTVAKFRHELGIPPMLSRRRPRAATAEA